MAEKQVRIDLVANDKASRVVEGLADDVEKLEESDPEVTVTADTTKAETAVADLSDDMRALTRQDQEVLLRADVDKAKGTLREFQSSLDDTADKARRTEKAVDDIGRAQGPRLAGNTVADLTGPLGEASGVASDVGGVFDGLGDSAEAAWIKMGGSEAGAANVGQMLGYAGFAVSAGVALWTLYRSSQKKAEEQQKKLTEGAKKLRDALEEGDVDTGAAQLVEDYGKVIREADKAGVSVEGVTQFITGQADAIPGLTDAVDTVLDKYDQYTEKEIKAGLAGDETARQTLLLNDAVNASRDAYDKANGSLDDQEDILGKVKTGLGDAAGETDDLRKAQEKAERQSDRLKTALDKIRGALSMEQALLTFQSQIDTAMANAGTDAAATSGDILDIKQSIVDVAEYAELNPVQVRSLLEMVDQGDLAGVRAAVGAYYDASPAQVNTALEGPTEAELRAMANHIRQRLRDLVGDFFGGGGSHAPGQPWATTTSAPAVNVTQYVPHGYRGDLLADAHAAAKRSGGLYQRNRR